MRRLALVVALLALPAAAATEAYVVLLDWREGHSLAGTTPLLTSPLAERLPFAVDACHRTLLLDLLYEPEEAGVGQDGVGEAAILFEFVVETWRGAHLLSRQRVASPGYGKPLGVTGVAGEHELRLSLATGVDVHWDVRVRGREVPGELACFPRVVVNEVEADPAGPDAGREWVELYNADPAATVDLSLWTLRSTHGATRELVLPQGTLLGPGARLQVVFADGQFLDNADESVVLLDGLGMLRDATPVASDGKDDGRTWQRAPDGSDAWVFAAATPP